MTGVPGGVSGFFRNGFKSLCTACGLSVISEISTNHKGPNNSQDVCLKANSTSYIRDVCIATYISFTILVISD